MPIQNLEKNYFTYSVDKVHIAKVQRGTHMQMIRHLDYWLILLKSEPIICLRRAKEQVHFNASPHS